MLINTHNAKGQGANLEDVLIRLGQVIFLAYISEQSCYEWQCQTSFYAVVTAFYPKTDELELQVLPLPKGQTIRVSLSSLENQLESKEIFMDVIDSHLSQIYLLNQQIKMILKCTRDLYEMILDSPELFLEWKSSVFFKVPQAQRGFMTKEWVFNQEWFSQEDAEIINWLMVSETLSQEVGV